MSLKEEKRVYELPEEEEETEQVKKYNKAPVYLKEYVESFDNTQMDAVADFLTQDQAASKKLAGSIALIIMSLALLIAGVAIDEVFYMETLGMLVGLGGMFGAIVFGIAGIVKAAHEKGAIKTILDRTVITDSIKDYVEDLDRKNNRTFVKKLVTGILMCVFSPFFTALLAAVSLSEGVIFGSVAAFFAFIALGVYLIVSSAMISDSYKKVIFYNDRAGYRRYRNNRRRY